MTEQPQRALHVLFLDDGSPERDDVLSLLRADRGWTVTAGEAAALPRHLSDDSADLIVTELSLWGRTPLALLEQAQRSHPLRPVIVLTSRGDERWAAAAIRSGATDYISKRQPDYPQRLQCSLRAAAHKLAAGEAWPAGTSIELRNREQRDQLLHKALRLTAVVGFEGCVRHWNEAWDGILGYSTQEMLGLRLRDLLHPNDQQVSAAIRARTQSGESIYGIEARLRCKDGSYKWLLWNSVPCVEQQVYVVTLYDITPRKLYLQQLRESEERFRMAARATCEAIFDWDLRTGEIWRSEGFQSMFGYQPDEVGPDLKWWQDRIHPDDLARVQSTFMPHLPRGPGPLAFEYRFRRADGSYADVFDRSYVMFSADGQPLRMIGAIADISEQKRDEEVAHLHRAELAHIARVRTMGEIATGLAHELNQPLTAIANYAEGCARLLADMTPDAQQKLQGWVERIALNTHRAGEMIRRLRGFIRKGEPRRAPVNINEIIGEVIELVEAEARTHGVRIRGEPQSAVEVTADRVQIQQVLVNLLRNAMEAMSGNSPGQRQLTIRTSATFDTVEVAVADEGIGIAEKDRDRVFDAFFTSKPDGMGIGLAISRTIIEDHGGRLWLSPNPVRGVTFHFTLPTLGV